MQLLDERQSSDGKLIIETRATARGLVPDIEELVDTNVPGFKLVETADSDVSVLEFDKESMKTAIVSERTWTLQYAAADPKSPTPETFSFPQPIVDTNQVAFERYVDADLEEVESIISLAEQYGSSERQWTIIAFCVAAALLMIVGVGFAIRSQIQAGETITEREKSRPTPVGVVTQLRNLATSPSLPTERMPQLKQDLQLIEKHYFAESNGAVPPDLEAIAERWS